MCNLDYWILTLILHLYNLLNLLILYTCALLDICNKTKSSRIYATHFEFVLSSLHFELIFFSFKQDKSYMCMAGSLLTSWKPLILMWTTLTGKPRFVPVLTWLHMCRWAASSAAAHCKDSAQNGYFSLCGLWSLVHQISASTLWMWWQAPDFFFFSDEWQLGSVNCTVTASKGFPFWFWPFLSSILS